MPDLAISTGQKSRSKVDAGRVPELDGLRSLAILPVILHHCYPPGSWLGFLGEPGWIGVDLFFVLSGYLITGILVNTAGQQHYYRNFLVRRAVRILPLYYLCLLLFDVATRLMDHNAWNAFQSWGGVGWFVVYLGNVRAAVQGSLPPVFSFAPLWSLQVEEQFYLFYPVIVAILPVRILRVFLIICVGFALGLRCFLVFTGRYTVAAYVLTPCRMDALALGGLVSISQRTGGWFFRRPVAGRALLVGLVAMVIMFGVAHMAHEDSSSLPFMKSFGYTVIDLTFAALLTYVLLSRSSPLCAPLRWRPLIYTGQISYGLYLLHAPSSWFVRHPFGIESHSFASLPITFVASFVAATISWKFFESPLLRLKDRLGPQAPAVNPTSIAS